MNCNDDIPGDISSLASATIGVPFEGSFNVDQCESDPDYIRVDLEYGRLYFIRQEDDNPDVYRNAQFDLAITNHLGRVLPYAATETLVEWPGIRIFHQFFSGFEGKNTHFVRPSVASTHTVYVMTD